MPFFEVGPRTQKRQFLGKNLLVAYYVGRGMSGDEKYLPLVSYHWTITDPLVIDVDHLRASLWAPPGTHSEKIGAGLSKSVQGQAFTKSKVNHHFGGG